MTPRERIKTAFAHKKPDRLPRYEIFLADFIREWRSATQSSPDADIYAAYPKIDIGRILASQEGPFMRLKSRTDDAQGRTIRDSWGRLTRHKDDAYFFEVLETAITRKSDLDALQFDDPEAPGRADLITLEREAQRASDRFAPVSGVMGLFMPSHYLRGELQFLTDLAEDSAFCRALVGRVAEFVTGLGRRVLEVTDTWDTAIWVYDDFGSNTGPLVSPRTFENIFLPAYRAMIADWKSRGARNVILHYDANCWDILDMLIDAGFTGIQGIYPSANMSIPEVKAKVGDRLVLIGGVCNVSVLAPGPEQAIERAVASIVEVARDGGVVIGAHSIDKDIPVSHYEHYTRVLEQVDAAW